MNQESHSTVWLIDPVHSSIRFQARYLLLSAVSGRFTQFEGRVVSPSADFTQCGIQLKIYTNSIQTGSADRDEHLKSPDFFDARQYPALSFYSTSAEGRGDRLAITGNLAIRDQVQSISFEALYTGTATDEMGNRKAGFELALELRRKDFGLHWNRLLDQSRLLVSEMVSVQCEIQLLQLR
jgi:polyisoprenoid-binding protein YceI